MKKYVLEREVVVPRPLDEVFDFFSDPRNLARITPPWLAFEMTGWEPPAGDAEATGAGARRVQSGKDGGSGGSVDGRPAVTVRSPDDGRLEMAEGLRLHYRVRPLLVAQRWTSLITDWDPPNRFTDIQIRGPYRLWRHTHGFRAESTGTRVSDRVEYALPLGPLGRLAHLLLVHGQLQRIFEFRLHAMNRVFGIDQESKST